MRVRAPVVAAGTLVVLAGGAGLVRAAVPTHPGNSGGTASAPIIVTGAYVRAPVLPNTSAAAYFTVHNTTAKADTLLDIQTGAGASAVLHTDNADGTMSAVPTATVPAHGTLSLVTGKAHVMITRLFGTLSPGQTVNIDLDFANAGQVDVTAPVRSVMDEGSSS